MHLIILSWLGGIWLGWIHHRLYVRSLQNLMKKPENSAFRKLAVKAGLFRYVFIFLAGICLIRGARLVPIHLCGGLLLTSLGYLRYANPESETTEGDT